MRPSWNWNRSILSSGFVRIGTPLRSKPEDKIERFQFQLGRIF